MKNIRCFNCQRTVDVDLKIFKFRQQMLGLNTSQKIEHLLRTANRKRRNDQIAAGITLDDGDIHADSISYASDTDKSQVGIEIHSGKNRIVRRIFESLGYRVTKLDRVYFAGLTKKGLRRGDWRFLTEQEVNMLRMGSFE